MCGEEIRQLVCNLPCMHIQHSITLEEINGNRDLQCMACGKTFAFKSIDEYGSRQYEPRLGFSTESSKIYVSCLNASFNVDSVNTLKQIIKKEAKRLQALFVTAPLPLETNACCHIKPGSRLTRARNKELNIILDILKIVSAGNLQEVRMKLIKNANKISSVAHKYLPQTNVLIQNRTNLQLCTVARGTCAFCSVAFNMHQEALFCAECNSGVCARCFLLCVEFSKNATFEVFSNARKLSQESASGDECCYLQPLDDRP